VLTTHGVQCLRRCISKITSIRLFLFYDLTPVNIDLFLLHSLSNTLDPLNQGATSQSLYSTLQYEHQYLFATIIFFELYAQMLQRLDQVVDGCPAIEIVDDSRSTPANFFVNGSLLNRSDCNAGVWCEDSKSLFLTIS
jgi:hypothetical protein